MNSLSNRISKSSIEIFTKYKLKNIEQNNLLICHKSTTTAAIKYATVITYSFLLKSYKTVKNLIEGKKPPPPKQYPENTVVIFQFPRGFRIPSLSMFALKLETWCRAADIKYQNELSMQRSSQGLIPFIRLNNFQVEDSQKCIEYLSKVFEKDLNKDLTSEQRAVSRLVIKVCDDSLRWTVALFRFWHSDKNLKNIRVPRMAEWAFSYGVYKSAYAAGYSRMSKEDLIQSGKNDLRALNTLIGNKKYLFSDTQPSDADFAIFGNVAQIIYNDMEPFNQFLTTDCQNLKRHTENIKETYWKDWDSHILASRLPKPVKIAASNSLISKITSLLKKK